MRRVLHYVNAGLMQGRGRAAHRALGLRDKIKSYGNVKFGPEVMTKSDLTDDLSKTVSTYPVLSADNCRQHARAEEMDSRVLKNCLRIFFEICCLLPASS